MTESTVDKQLIANRKAEAAYLKHLRQSNEPTRDERAAAEKARLYFDHKICGSLDTYYDLCPEDRPKACSRDDGGRER